MEGRASAAATAALRAKLEAARRDAVASREARLADESTETARREQLVHAAVSAKAELMDKQVSANSAQLRALTEELQTYKSQAFLQQQSAHDPSAAFAGRDHERSDVARPSGRVD